MKSLKGTLTEKNLLTSFAGESQARMRYTYFAGEAKREGYEQIAAVFKLTAKQEKMHAERMFRFLEGGMVEICATYPAGEIRTTMENLRAAAAGEHEEWHDLYPSFANIAEDEGFKEVALMYRAICVAEQEHEHTFHRLLPVAWQCRGCGYTYTGKKAPDRCPSCLHPKGYFEIKAENY